MILVLSTLFSYSVFTYWLAIQNSIAGHAQCDIVQRFAVYRYVLTG